MDHHRRRRRLVTGGQSYIQPAPAQTVWGRKYRGHWRANEANDRSSPGWIGTQCHFNLTSAAQLIVEASRTGTGAGTMESSVRQSTRSRPFQASLPFPLVPRLFPRPAATTSSLLIPRHLRIQPTRRPFACRSKSPIGRRDEPPRSGKKAGAETSD